VGSALASILMPRDIPIPGGLKMPIQYAFREAHNGGVQVDASGMYAGGFLLAAVPREPAVALTGQRHISLHIGGGGVEDTIRALPVDLRGDLAFAWTLNGKPFHWDGPSI